MADLPPLATSEDYIARYGSLPSGFNANQVDQLLADLSDQVREAAGWQQISLVTDDTVELRGSGALTMGLPQRPVVAVTAIDGLTTSKWSWDGKALSRVDGYQWDGPVTVTYSHGYDPVPAWLVGMCCQVIRRSANNQDGLRSESTSIDDYTKTRTYATETVNVPIMLTDDERDRIRKAFVADLSTVAL